MVGCWPASCFGSKLAPGAPLDRPRSAPAGSALAAGAPPTQWMRCPPHENRCASAGAAPSSPTMSSPMARRCAHRRSHFPYPAYDEAKLSLPPPIQPRGADTHLYRHRQNQLLVIPVHIVRRGADKQRDFFVYLFVRIITIGKASAENVPAVVRRSLSYRREVVADMQRPTIYPTKIFRCLVETTGFFVNYRASSDLATVSMHAVKSFSWAT